MPDTDKKKKTADEGRPTGALPRVKWDDTGMTTTYANVCNVAGTREEVTLLFGTNQTGLSDQQVSVRLSDRIILSPYAAKRLAALLNNVVAQYEKRFGDLSIDAPAGDAQ
jgi:hypothetical protein